MPSLANYFSFIHINNFPTSSIACYCFLSTSTPLATSALLMASLYFKTVLIVLSSQIKHVNSEIITF